MPATTRVIARARGSSDQQAQVDESHDPPQVSVPQLQQVVVVVQPPASGDWIVSGACLVLLGVEKTSTSTDRSIASTTFLAISFTSPYAFASIG